MAEDAKENPFKLPFLKITKRDKLIIKDNEGKWINSADPNTPSYQVRDVAHPERLPQQQPPKNVNNN